VVFKHQLEAAGFSSRCFPELVCVHREHKGYLRTLKWMHESGVSATHQLFRFRPLRSADLAVIAWLLFTLIFGLLGGLFIGIIATVGWILAVATGHTLRRFLVKMEVGYLARLLMASFANSTLIICYFVGRLSGVVVKNRVPHVVQIDRVLTGESHNDRAPFGE
jgi:hypothetical protein